MHLIRIHPTEAYKNIPKEPKSKIQKPKNPYPRQRLVLVPTHLIASRTALHPSSSHSIRDIIPHNTSHPYKPTQSVIRHTTSVTFRVSGIGQRTLDEGCSCLYLPVPACLPAYAI